MENKITFIETDYIKNHSICDKLVATFERSNEKTVGRASINGAPMEPVLDIKDSLELSITDYSKYPEIIEYIQCLDKSVRNYIEKYNFCNWYSPWNITEPINIQYYKPGGGYKAWHTERTSSDPVNSSRHLVFMTYLNDVTDAGETEFYYQNLKIQPRKGLTVIWPADWTHTHRGIPSPTQEKYIITGWLNYVSSNQ
jgi:hypothetical protein